MARNSSLVPARDTLAVFDGKNPDKAAKWFEIAVGIERYAEFSCGTPGVEIWLGIAPVLTDENVSDAAEEALASKTLTSNHQKTKNVLVVPGFSHGNMVYEVLHGKVILTCIWIVLFVHNVIFVSCIRQI